jgi:hypothetical protein
VCQWRPHPTERQTHGAGICNATSKSVVTSRVFALHSFLGLGFRPSLFDKNKGPSPFGAEPLLQSDEEGVIVPSEARKLYRTIGPLRARKIPSQERGSQQNNGPMPTKHRAFETIP